MIKLEVNTALLYLPNPNLGNSKAQTSKITVKRMMDNSIHTYITKRTQLTHRFPLVLTRLKALEFLEFTNLFSGEKVKLTDHEDNIINCYIMVNPTELEMQKRSIYCDSKEEVELELVVEES